MFRRLPALIMHFQLSVVFSAYLYCVYSMPVLFVLSACLFMLSACLHCVYSLFVLSVLSTVCSVSLVSLFWLDWTIRRGALYCVLWTSFHEAACIQKLLEYLPHRPRLLPWPEHCLNGREGRGGVGEGRGGGGVGEGWARIPAFNVV